MKPMEHKINYNGVTHTVRPEKQICPLSKPP